MNSELRNIFNKEGLNILDLSKWTEYYQKNDLEKSKYSRYHFVNLPNINKQVSIGVFYTKGSQQEIDYIAWGYREEKDCSYNAKIRDNLYIDKIISGCPIEDIKDYGYLSEQYLPIYFYLSLTFFSSALFTLLFYGNDWMEFMRLYMGTFFVLFGFLKIINIKKFVSGFESYDLIAKKYPGYGYSYAFLELITGLLFSADIYIVYANILTILILLPTTIGIIQSIIRGERLNCVCLGGFFNIPIGPITIFENAIMIAMALYMFF